MSRSQLLFETINLIAAIQQEMMVQPVSREPQRLRVDQRHSDQPASLQVRSDELSDLLRVICFLWCRVNIKRYLVEIILRLQDCYFFSEIRILSIWN